jgi:hypothetical protein
LLSFAVSAFPTPVLAGGTPGKIVSADADKVVVRFENGGGGAFPAGMRDIEIRCGGKVVVRGRVMTSAPDEATFAVIRGKGSALAPGSPVEVEQSTAAEGVDGC